MSQKQIYSGTSAPLRGIVGLGDHGGVGRWVLLDCTHWKQIRDFDIMPAMGRRQPVRARCGLCENPPDD
jgi:hypothetical protein